MGLIITFELLAIIILLVVIGEILVKIANHMGVVLM